MTDERKRETFHERSSATPNGYRALLSFTYKLAIRNGKVKENPARLVQHRLEDNARIRFLSVDEETALRKAVEGKCPERMPEFDVALNTGLRLRNVSLPLRVLTITRSKNGARRHVRLNQAAVKALETLRGQYQASELVCCGTDTGVLQRPAMQTEVLQ